MLKKFFISMLGTIAGVWVAIAIAFFCMLGLVGAIMGSSAETGVKVDKHSALYIDLKGEMPERFQPGDIWQMIRQSENSGDALVDILESIRMAANDSHIDGIYINCASGSTAGMASREEIVEALRQFKRSGKWIVAYGDTYGQGDYLLASMADSLYLNPMGAVDVHGMASRIPFFKGLLDKLGVEMQIVRVGTYKSAVEPFMGTEMSSASRLQTTAMLDSMWTYTKDVIADGRGVDAGQINLWADSIISTWPARQVENAGAVGPLLYRRQAEDVIRNLCDLDDDDDLRLVTPTDYMSSKKPADSSHDHIAVLFAVGDIVDSGEGGIAGDEMVPEILRLADDDNVQALVLRVNSGGGSAYASEQIWEALEYFKSQGKPFYVSMGDYAASGGYYISCGADRIYADRTTLTGSIGVFGMIPDLSGLVTDKLGVSFSTVATNPVAVPNAPFGPLNPEMRAGLQRSVDDMYETFTGRVAAGRDMPQDSVKVIAEGRVWTGGAALSLGLIDRIGGLQTVINDMAETAGIDADKVVFYPEVGDDLLSEIMRQAAGNVTVGGVSVDRGTLQMMRLLDYLRRQPAVQARMTPVEIY
ncbi:MAG: signal peptide peptidase SppA [Bacteroidales bacterium]|nr:signal peptide peptidase SppA [Bacteroidales bacterium]